MNQGRWHTGQQMRISCMSALHIINYFTGNYAIPVERLLDGLSVNLDFIKNTGNWLNHADTYGLFLNCSKYTPALTHREWASIGENIYRGNAPGYFKVLFKLLPLKKIYNNVPKYAKSMSTISDYEIVSHVPNEVVYKRISNSSDITDHYLTGCECSYHLGVVNAIAKVTDEYAYHSEAHHDICSMPLQVILEKYYSMGPGEYRYERNSLYIEGVKCGVRVQLKPRRDSGECLSSEHTVLKEDEPGGNATLITRDVYYRGLKILKNGEIYDAPHCVYRINYRKKFLVAQRLSGRKLVLFLESQLKLTEEKCRQAVTSKQETERALEEVGRRGEIIAMYMRDSIYSEINKGLNPLEYKPQKKPMVIMFSDIRNFACITESMDPLNLTEFLNAYFKKVNQPIVANNGEIDKLIGDGLMAVFRDCNEAVRAAVEMQKVIDKEGHDLIAAERGRLKAGIGINFDEVVEGNIGTPGTKMDRTIIGDGVNLASRLESLTKFYRTDILVSEYVREELGPDTDVRYIDTIVVKGKTKPVEIYEVLNAQPKQLVDFKKETLKEYKTAIALYKAGDFIKSLYAFVAIRNYNRQMAHRDRHLLDPVLDVYITRLAELLNNADDYEFMSVWDGVYKHKSK